MTLSSPTSAMPPNHALTQNVLRAIQAAPSLNKVRLLTHLQVLDQGFDPQNPKHREAERLARTIIHTVAIDECVIRTLEQVGALDADPRLLGLVQEFLQEENSPLPPS